MFSIIIPTLNEESLIAQTITQFDNIKNKYDIEIIVSDSSSTDNTVEIAKRYTDEIRLISHNEIKKMFLGSFVWKEKFLGFNKSFIAHNFDTKN